MILSFIFFLALFTLIGVSAAFKSKNNKHDYYLASSSVSPTLVGLSAVATNNSGYMFIGVIGYTYVTGLASIWLMFGWIIGDFLGSLYIHSRLRKATEQTKEVSFAGVLSNWGKIHHNAVQTIIGLITLVFLLAYASAQLIAGSKALHVLLGWPNWAGAVIGAVLVTIYCISGGIRASIWTDAAQSVVMVAAMFTLLFYGLGHFGGILSAVNEMAKIEGYLDWFPEKLALPGISGMLLFIVGWGFAGFSVIGQPHIMVRFMTLSDTGKMRTARFWYYLWFIVFYVICTAVGMLSRIYINNPANFDAELALPIMAQGLLPKMLVGLILAGIFAATISTADSLVLSCSSALTHDLFPNKIERPLLIKLSTGVITITALIIALNNSQSVFNLVIMSWSALASAFAPLLIFKAVKGKTNQTVSILSIVVGLITALFWRQMGWHQMVYEGFPGIVSGLLLLLLTQAVVGPKKG